MNTTYEIDEEELKDFLLSDCQDTRKSALVSLYYASGENFERYIKNLFSFYSSLTPENGIGFTEVLKTEYYTITHDKQPFADVNGVQEISISRNTNNRNLIEICKILKSKIAFALVGENFTKLFMKILNI